jgi:hypothetical protein
MIGLLGIDAIQQNHSAPRRFFGALIDWRYHEFGTVIRIVQTSIGLLKEIRREQCLTIEAAFTGSALLPICITQIFDKPANISMWA